MIMTLPKRKSPARQGRRGRLARGAARMRAQGRPERGAAAGPILMHLPRARRLRASDLSLAGALLFLLGLGVFLAGHLRSAPRPPDEILEMAEAPPPPVETKEPPKPPPPPPARTPPPQMKADAPPPVFGLQQDETSDAGDMAAATGNTLAAKADSVVRPAPPPLYAEPVELDRAPGFLKQVVADYPEWAQDQGVEAVVRVWVTIDVEGRVTDAALQRGAGKDFDAAALRAARASLFRPLVKDGVRLPSRFVVAYDFKLEG